MLRGGFLGTGVANGRVIVVKTHFPVAASHGVCCPYSYFNKVVLLIRDPVDAIISYFNYEHGGHLGLANTNKYQTTNFTQYGLLKVRLWAKLNNAWIKAFPEESNRLIVLYGDLVHNTTKVLRKLLDFLDIKVQEEVFECVDANSKGLFKRKHQDEKWRMFDDQTVTRMKLVKSRIYCTLNMTVGQKCIF